MSKPPSSRYPAKDERLWRTAIEDLRTECPPLYPVRVSRRRIPNDTQARCKFVPKPGSKSYFLIQIQPDLDFQYQIELLIHEWAHAMAWFAPETGDKTDHPDEWGLCVARCHRAVIHD